MNFWEQECTMTRVIAKDQNTVFSEIKVKRRKEEPTSKKDSGGWGESNEKDRAEVWDERVDFSK